MDITAEMLINQLHTTYDHDVDFHEHTYMANTQ